MITFLGLILYVCYICRNVGVFPTFSVTLNDSSVEIENISIPKKFIIKLAYESLDFLHPETTQPIIQFPYQSIICWGSSEKIFQFNAFPSSLNNVKQKDTIKVIVNTKQAKLIDTSILRQIRLLMADIEATAVSKDEFIALKLLLFDASGNLNQNWLTMVDQFSSTGRYFLAKQGMELMLMVSFAHI